MRIGRIVAAGLLLGSLAGAPSFAEMGNSTAPDSGMSSHPSVADHGMSAKPTTTTAAEDLKMRSCMKMSHDMMAKDAECVRLKKPKDGVEKNKGGAL